MKHVVDANSNEALIIDETHKIGTEFQLPKFFLFQTLLV